jgi:diguanylate cyclase (GGDEF)-like protein
MTVAVEAPSAVIRVLLIEDDPRDMGVLRAMLRNTGGTRFGVSHVTSVNDAILELGREDTDIVILDLSLPDASELEGLERIRSFTSEVPVIVLTGNQDESLSYRALHRGAQDYLVKGSVDRNLLVRSIRYSIERHRGVRDLATVTRQLQIANANLERLTVIDPLTELLNRRGLQQALSSMVQRIDREGIDVVVLFVDIDDFKRINDTLGHAVGDVALKEIARKLSACVRGVDCLARIGGDEFLLLVTNSPPSEAVRIAERVRLAVSTTVIQLNTGTLQMTASIGVMMLKADTPSIDELLTHTHQVLYRSKQGGKNRVSYAGKEFEDTAKRLRAQSDMCTALSRGDRLASLKQAIYRLSDEQVVGYEFLSRFVNGIVEMPENFFRVCSERNILTLVDHQCLRRGIAAATELPPELRFHLNVFPSTLIAIPAQHLIEEFPLQVPPRTFCIEISEQQILGEPSYLTEPVKAFRDAGILIGIDDVGFGNSCLESLILLEPDVIKVDKRCVRGIELDPDRQRQLVRYLEVAERLGADVIAEGIEGEQELRVLRNLGVRYGQGYYWGLPA